MFATRPRGWPSGCAGPRACVGHDRGASLPACGLRPIPPSSRATAQPAALPVSILQQQNSVWRAPYTTAAVTCGHRHSTDRSLRAPDYRPLVVGTTLHVVACVRTSPRWVDSVQDVRTAAYMMGKAVGPDYHFRQPGATHPDRGLRGVAALPALKAAIPAFDTTIVLESYGDHPVLGPRTSSSAFRCGCWWCGVFVFLRHHPARSR